MKEPRLRGSERLRDFSKVTPLWSERHRESAFPDTLEGFGRRRV